MQHITPAAEVIGTSARITIVLPMTVMATITTGTVTTVTTVMTTMAIMVTTTMITATK
ncbi:hypothetical protein [Bradyrhizobium cenepequi]